jgi:tRNA (guanine37-N1)-methyltransferase
MLQEKREERPRVDKRPYGGGPGMVIEALPVIKALEHVFKKIKDKKKTKIIFLNPSGKQFDTAYAKAATKKYSDIVIISGRYEGIDARGKKIFKTERYFYRTICIDWRGTAGHDSHRLNFQTD